MSQWARLGPLRTNDPGSDFIFSFAVNPDGVVALAPNSLERTRSSTYVTVPVALSDHLPEEWKANNPTDINLGFEVIGTKNHGVDDALKKLRKFMRKDKRTGEPLDLAFVMGKKHWAVRIHRMTEKVTLWNRDTDETRVKVSLTLRTIDVED